MKHNFAYFLLLSTACFCDVLSTNGKIQFNTQIDGQPEMILNSMGLGIGISPSANLHVNGNALVSNQLFIGGNSGSSNLNVSGTIGFGFQTISSNTTLNDSSIVLIDTSSDNITLTLPYAGNVSGRVYFIKKTSQDNSLWIHGGGSFIDQYHYVLFGPQASLQSIEVISNGLNWHVINSTESLNHAVASDNIVVWWTFDDLSGKIATDSGPLGIHGYLKNGANFSGNSVASPIAFGLYLDGIDDYIYVGGNNLKFDTGNTFSVWLRSDLAIGTGSHINYPGIFASGINVFDNYVGFSSTGGVGNGFYVEDVDGSLISKGNLFNYTAGDWMHVVLTRPSSGNITYYINGESVGNSLNGAFDAVDINYIGIGYGGATNDGAIKGVISDMILYNKILSDEEIASLFHQ